MIRSVGISRRIVTAIVMVVAFVVSVRAAGDDPVVPDSLDTVVDVKLDNQTIAEADSIVWELPQGRFDGYNLWFERDEVFNPSPTRAVWMSALFPGLGQVYNRRYWKLPLVVGGYLGLAYATSWNNGMLNDYQRAYRDIMDNDPSPSRTWTFFRRQPRRATSTNNG